MNGIMGFAELLLEPEVSEDQSREYLSLIQQSGEPTLTVINNIIQISKIESGIIELEYSNIHLNAFLDHIYATMKLDADQKQLNFKMLNSLINKELILSADSEKLYSILTNLIKNAIKYTSSGDVEFGCRLTDNWLEFFVKDTGIGIPSERQNAIFERFMQADIADKMAYQGAGLGLSISKAYVELMGGHIRLESQAGKGSAFSFTIPFTPASDVALKADWEAAGVEAPDHKNSHKKLKILIAEDDKASERLLSIELSPIASEILRVTNGLDAVELCRKNPDIDLVLMDIQMPGIDGYEATRRIREFNKDVQIIAQTAFAMTGDREKALSAGCNAYITKPILKHELLR